MDNSAVQLSIVIPAHNEAAYLPATLEALQSALSALEIRSEIIVVDDASTDATSEIAKARDCRVHRVELRNIGAVRNAGAEQALGSWLIFVDADTCVPAQTVCQTVEFLSQGILGGGAWVQADKIETYSWTKRWMFATVATVWLKWGRWAAGCYMFCTREAFQKVGGFNTKYFAAEEFFFSRALKRVGPFRLVTHPVVTSTRKLKTYSTWQLFRFLVGPIVTGSFLRSRRGLEILYEDRR